MSRNLISIMLLLSIPLLSSSQVHVAWKQVWGGTYDDDWPKGMAVDTKGNVYVTGQSETSDFTTAIVTVKYSRTGERMWVHYYDGPANWAAPGGIAVDDAEHVYVTGRERRLGTSLTDAVTIKLSSIGDTVWTKHYRYFVEVFPSARADGIVIDPYGIIHVAGRVDSIGGSRSYLLHLAYNPSGELIDGMTWGGGYMFVTGQMVADSHSVYLSGYAQGQTLVVRYLSPVMPRWLDWYGVPSGSSGASVGLTLDRKGNLYVATLKPTGPGAQHHDCAVVKYSTEGMVWERVWTSSLGGGLNSIAADSACSVVASGSYGTPPIWPAAFGSQPVTLKYDSAGTLLWEQKYPGSGNAGAGFAIATDRRGNAYIAGYEKNASRGNEWLVLKYAPDGTQKWSTGFALNSLSDNAADHIFVDDGGNIYVSGWAQPNSSSPYNTEYVAMKFSQKAGFRAVPNGWSLANSNPPMWKAEFWRDIDYSKPPYPFDFTKWPIMAKSSDFPSWPLFVDAFGEDQAYFPSSPPGTYIWKPDAFIRWRSVAGAWGGSCFGFPISSLLFYNDYLLLEEAFPSAGRLCDVPEEYKSVTMVNRYFLHQYGKEHLDSRIASISRTPKQTAMDLIQMLTIESRNNRSLIFWNNGQGGGAHSVVPCSLSTNTGNPNVLDLTIYDSNYPLTDQLIQIDTSANTWSCNNYPGWGGSKWFILVDSIATYATRPTMPLAAGIRPAAAPGGRASSLMTEVYATRGMGIRITNSAGKAIGYSSIDSSLVVEIPDAMPIIPETGQKGPPIGFYVPAGSYSITGTVAGASPIAVAALSDSSVFWYKRRDTHTGETDRLSLRNVRDIVVQNPDPAPRSIYLQSVSLLPDRQMGCALDNLSLQAADSLGLSIVEGDKFSIRNYGLAATYDLGLELAMQNANPRFRHAAIPLKAGSLQVIAPGWSTLDTGQVLIYVDEDLDGTFDDTLIVKNNLTQVDDHGGTGALPREYHLEQNYPNPFNPTTVVNYQVPVASDVRLAVYDLLGREVAVLVDERKPAGSYEVKFDGAGLSSGVYLYRLTAGTFVQTRKMILVR